MWSTSTPSASPSPSPARSGPTSSRSCRRSRPELAVVPAEDVDAGGGLRRERLDLEARVAHVDEEVEAVELAVGGAPVRAGWIAAVAPEQADVVPAARGRAGER